MATTYNCNNFKDCTQVQAKHYCAKQNQPKLVLNPENSNSDRVTSICDTVTSLCNSAEAHVHKIKQELSTEGSHLKTTYTIYQDRIFQKDSIYHFDRKN